MACLCDCIHGESFAYRSTIFSLVGYPQSWKVACIRKAPSRGMIVFRSSNIRHLVNPTHPQFTGISLFLFVSCARNQLTGAFLDFWMGDQFCSLTYTLSNIWLLGCAYELGWPDNTYKQCSISRKWAIPFLLSALPSFVRFVQCIKRYVDSGLETHLINVSVLPCLTASVGLHVSSSLFQGGKYTAGILFYLFYFIWRHAGTHISLILRLVHVFTIMS